MEEVSGLTILAARISDLTLGRSEEAPAAALLPGASCSTDLASARRLAAAATQAVCAFRNRDGIDSHSGLAADASKGKHQLSTGIHQLPVPAPPGDSIDDHEGGRVAVGCRASVDRIPHTCRNVAEEERGHGWGSLRNQP